MNMLHQGSQFYSQLSDYLSKLYQNVTDFKMCRDIEAKDLVARVAGV